MNAEVANRALHRWRSSALALVVIGSALTIDAVWVARLDRTRTAIGFAWYRFRGGYSVDERIAQYSSGVGARLQPTFQQIGVPYPPAELTYVVIKDTRRLEVYARVSESKSWRFVRSYVVLGLSGDVGPKLREGDYQVPEGLYAAEYLNPNSRYHLSVRLNYPNQIDRMRAEVDGRTANGSDIMIHGGTSSTGCLAMGDQAAEDLFVLAALATKEHVRILVSPTDFRRPESVAPAVSVPWGDELYKELRAALSQYPSEGDR